MHLLNKFFNNLNNKKKKQQQKESDLQDNSHTDASVSSTSTITEPVNNKRFSTLRKYYTLTKRTKNNNRRFSAVTDSTTISSTIEPEMKYQQELLLTQCIENALYFPTTVGRNTISSDKNQKRKTVSFLKEQSIESQNSKSRRFSLPPQTTNIGYLASIPEVDSQILIHKV